MCAVAQWSVSVYVEEVWCTAQAVQGQCGREDQKGLDSAWAGNRTRASRVAGENSTTEPPMLQLFGVVSVELFSGLFH